jgi:RHS repeat-associated protein
LSGDVAWLHGDHLGSTSLTTNESGEAGARQLCAPFGEVRWASGALGTDFGFTGQREDGYIGLVQMGARWYNGEVGRWVSADTIVPEPADPQDFNRYAFSRNNPLRFVDPTGHQSQSPPLDPTMQEAIDYFTSLGWEVVGDPSLIHPNWNMADLVFTKPDGRVLAVELKDVAGNVNLGTLGKSALFGDYGGSIDRILRSARRFKGSSVEQFRLMCQAVLKGDEAGKLENALFTSSPGVSEGAQNIFGEVVRAGKEGVEVIKTSVKAAPAELKKPDFWTQVGIGARAFWHWGRGLLMELGNAATLPPIIFVPNPRFFFYQPYYLYPEPVDI